MNFISVAGGADGILIPIRQKFPTGRSPPPRIHLLSTATTRATCHQHALFPRTQHSLARSIHAALMDLLARQSDGDLAIATGEHVGPYVQRVCGRIHCGASPNC